MRADQDPVVPGEDDGESPSPAVSSSPNPSIVRRWIRASLAGASGFESGRYLLRWMLIGLAIGTVAGLGAIVFYLAIDYATRFFLGTLVGYLPPAPLGEGQPSIVAMARPWMLPVVTGLGGLIAGLIVFGLAPEAEGHGTDAAIAAVHHHRGEIRARIPPIKLVASAITIGSGGSGGREGPAAQISAGFGSLLGRWLHLDAAGRRIAVTAGMGAGIGAIFRAPLGGAVMAAEILYVHDLEVEALIPGLIASIVGYTIYGAFFGFTPIFGNQAALALGSPVELLYYAALGVLAGIFGILYSRSFYGVADVFHHLRLPRAIKPALGGVLVGLMGLVVPGAIHMGYGWVQIGMSREILSIPLWMVLLLPLAKILATSLSIGSGGSGGIFGPGMVIGGLLGASFWRLTYGTFPAVPADPAPFVIVGMMATFGGIAHAPLAVMLMVAEMTGNLSLLAPAMIAVAISTALVGDNTIYRSQLPNRASSPAHRVRFSFPLLSSLYVVDAMHPAVEVREDEGLEVAAERLYGSGRAGVVVVDSLGKVVGRLVADEVVRAHANGETGVPASAAMHPPGPALHPDQPLDEALGRLAESGASWAPVVDGGRLVGQVHVRDAIAAYRAALQGQVRRARELPPNTRVFEVRLGADSHLVGHTLRETNLQGAAIVISITRGDEVIFPRAATRLAQGDVLLVVADPASEPKLTDYLRR